MTPPLRARVFLALVWSIPACRGEPPPPAAAPQARAPQAPVPAVPSWTPGPEAPPRDPALEGALEAAWRELPASARPALHHADHHGLPKYVNRLLLSPSPYLLQHAFQPVDWHAWGPDAFAQARALGRPVLLSIGYSTCHWCHVMAEESFEDPEIAALINRLTVPVKVDREERPDLDALYMAAVERFQGRGGWPMTVWLDADGRPFYADTYLPPRDGDRGRQAGLATVLQRMDAAWREQPDKVAEVGTQVAADLARELGARTPGVVDAAALVRAGRDAALSRADPVWGGADVVPRFPSQLPLRVLLREVRRSGDAAAATVARTTLTRMDRGGIHDHVGGGFHRYSTDRQWVVPHFEKMLYDNALLAMTYTEAWQLWGEPRDAAVARDTVGFLLRDLTLPGGCFAAGIDADGLDAAGEREEGAWATWTEAQLSAALPPAEAALVAAAFDVRGDGELGERHVLWRVRPDADVAAERGLGDADALDAALTPALGRLLETRERRARPHRDDKVVAAWNGLALSALARAGQTWSEPAWVAAAERCAAFLTEEVVVEGRLHRTWLRGRVGPPAMLDDQALVAAGLLDLFEVTGRRRWLDAALARMAAIDAAHLVAETGALTTRPRDADPLLADSVDQRDGPVPSGTSATVGLMLRLATLTADASWTERADRVLEAMGGGLARDPLAFDRTLLALQWRLGDPRSVVIVRPMGRDDAALVRAVSASGPAALAVVRVEEGDPEDLASRLPTVAGKAPIRQRPAAYVCRADACLAPVTEPSELQRVLAAGWPGRP